MIKSNERLIKVMKEASILKKKLRSKEKGLMRGLDPSNIIDSNRRKRSKNCKVKLVNKGFPNIFESIVQNPPQLIHKDSKISIEVSKE